MAHSDASSSRNGPISHAQEELNAMYRQSHHAGPGFIVNGGTGALVNNLTGGLNINRRTAEGSRMIRDNLHTVMEELRPLVERARTADTHGLSLSSWLRQTPAAPTEPARAADSVTINLDFEPHHHTAATTMQADNLVNNLREAAGTQGHQPHNNNNTDEAATYRDADVMHAQEHAAVNIPPEYPHDHGSAEAADLLRQSPETQAFLNVVRKYIPFLLILIAKGIYDHRAGILIFIGLFVTFSHANAVVKREIAKQGRRSLASLFVIVCNLLGCIFFIYYIFLDQKLYLSLVFIPPYSQPLSMWDLLWMVGVTDFVLKLITIILKVILASMPVTLIPFQKRGKMYLLIESSSQLYRSLTPIQPWLYYLLESYQGPEKVVGVFLSAAYMVSKGADLVARARLWRTAFWKVLQHVNLGSSPSKEQLATAGQQCPICHDDFTTPVLLHCRHIFCEACVATWFDREQTCPLCRAKVVDDPSWRDGSTTYFSQLY